MQPAGMVHALEIIHNLLEAGACLIDIHPSGRPPTLEIENNGNRVLVGHIHESDDFIEYAQAAEALESAIQKGWFTIGQQAAFDYQIISTSFQEFQDYLAEKYQDATVTPETNQAIQAALSGKTANQLVYTESVLISRMQRLAIVQ